MTGRQLDDTDIGPILIGEGLAREYHGGRRQGWCRWGLLRLSAKSYGKP